MALEAPVLPARPMLFTVLTARATGVADAELATGLVEDALELAPAGREHALDGPAGLAEVWDQDAAQEVPRPPR